MAIYSNGQVGWFSGVVPPPLPLLDTYTGSSAAYSLCKLRTAYTGNAILARRSSDNTETNISFDSNGNLDTTALLSFASGGSVYVKTFYDQSGNNRDLTQSSATLQPIIVNSGTLQTSGGKPCMAFDGSNDYLRNNALGSLFSGDDKPMTSYWVGDFTSTSIQDVFTLGLSTTGTGLEFWRPTYIDSSTYTSSKRDGVGTLKSVSNGVSTIGQQLISINTNGTLINVYKNGNQITTNGDINVGNTPLDNLSVGALVRNTVGSYSSIKLQELIMWASNESSNVVAINNNLKTFYSL